MVPEHEIQDRAVFNVARVEAQDGAQEPGSTPSPLSGRAIGQQHAAMVKSGIDPAFRLAWLSRQMAEAEALNKSRKG